MITANSRRLLLPLVLLSSVKSGQALIDCTNIRNYNFASFNTTNPDPILNQSLPTNWSWAYGKRTNTQETKPLKTSTTIITPATLSGGVTLTNTATTTNFLQLHQFFEIPVDDSFRTSSIPSPATSSSLRGTTITTVLYELEAKHVVTSSNPRSASSPPDNAYVKLATVDPSMPAFADKVRLILPTFPNTDHGSLLGYVFLEHTAATASDDGTGNAAAILQQRVSMFYDGLGSFSLESICAKRVYCSWDALIKYINRYYSYFGIRGPSRLDFVKRARQIQKLEQESTSTSNRNSSGDALSTDLEEASVLKLLGALTTSDPHVYLQTTNGTILPPMGFRPMIKSPLWEPTFTVLTKRLRQTQTWTRMIGDGTGTETLAMLGLLEISSQGGRRQSVYLMLTSLVADPSEPYNDIRQAMAELLKQTKYSEIILDLRTNMGGDERTGLRILQSILATTSNHPDRTREVVYATNSFRLDPEDSRRFYQANRTISVASESRANVIVLTSRNCISSCEGLVLALKAAAGAILVGESTAGASGNPKPFVIPNVGQAYISTWKAGDAQGVAFERIGIPPDIRVEKNVTKSEDPVLDTAIAHLKKTINTTGELGGSGTRGTPARVWSSTTCTWLLMLMWVW